MSDDFDLEAELVALGRSLVAGPPAPDLADLVLARLEAPAATADRPGPVLTGPRGPTAPRPRARRRLGWAVAAAVVLVLALIPPVRAAVVELLRIGGVVVREEPAPTRPTATPTSTPDHGPTVPLSRAEELVGARLAVPAVLGPPDAVVVAHDAHVVQLGWGHGAGSTRLDVFAGSLSWGYLKTVWRDVTPTRVGRYEAVWFGATHLVEWVDRAGGTHSDPPRVAGPTLVWVVPSPAGELTYRLEGPATLTEALRVAGSAG